MEDKTNTFLDSFKQAWTEGGEDHVDYFAGRTPPTTSPFINDLIGAGIALIEGTIDEERYRRTCDLTTYRLEEAMKIFMDYFNLQELPPDIKEEAAKALAAFNDQKAALAEIERYFQDHERSHITKGNEMTVTAAKSLIASYESFGAMASEYSKIECLKCGHRNPPESKLCEKCKTEIVLPKISQANLEMSFSDANDMPPNFANLFQAVENVRSGRSVPEEFGAAIDQFAVLIERQKPAMEKVLREDMKAIQPEVVGEEIYTAFRDLAEQMLASVDQTSSGLQWMKKYIDTRDAGDLTAGWERVLLGGKEMQRVTKAMGDLMTREGEALQAEASAEQPPPGESVTIRGEDE